MVPVLVGHTPHLKQNPWLFLECYVPKEDRYHPYSPNAWGVPENTPADELAQVGQYRHESCRLSCPCAGSCSLNAPGVVPAPLPAPFPPAVVPVPLPAPVPVPDPGCSGVSENQRCWYLSALGASCESTCASHGDGCSYSFAAPPTTDMVPQLVGHEPHSRMDAWLFVECYTPREDRFHPFNPNAWGVPEKTAPDELLEASKFSHDNCQFSCPCVGTCTGAISTTTSISDLGIPRPTFAPVPPIAPGGDWDTPGAVDQRCEDGEGIRAQDRCWYLSKVGNNCATTCAEHGLMYAFTAPVIDMVPKIMGHSPATRQAPWLFVECYVPGENRFHPYNSNAWGVPEKTPPEELAEAAQQSYPTCQLACSCTRPPP